jgi:hypothetical protein
MQVPSPRSFERFVQIIPEKLDAVFVELDNMQQLLFLHLVIWADYQSEVFDARSLYELGQDWSHSDSVTRKAFAVLDEKGLARVLPNKKGILVSGRKLVVYNPAGGNAVPAEGKVSPGRGNLSPVQGVSPAVLPTYIEDVEKDVSDPVGRERNIQRLNTCRDTMKRNG